MPIKQQELSDDGDLESQVAQARNRRLFRQAGCQADEGEVYLDHQKRHVPFGGGAEHSGGER